MINKTNPLFNSNQLKLGVFAINGGSNSLTLVPERFAFNWENSLDVARHADLLGFEAITPYARFRSMVGPLHTSGSSFECLTWAAAIAQATRYSSVMATVHVTNVHPLIAAKAMTTIDHISGGRFALNIVCGWFQEESEMFGTPFLNHEDRYAYGDEWIEAIKRLWTEDEEFDFDGRFVKIKKGVSQPKPIQRPYPALMNAATSPRGREFVAKHCDIAFIRPGSIQQMREDADAYREISAAQGREIQIWTPCRVVYGKTMADAEAMVERYADHADHAQVDATLSHPQRNMSAEARLAGKRAQAAFGSGLPLVGDAPTLVEKMAALSDAGLTGLLLTWVDFQGGIRSFGEEVLPLLEKAGLREKFSH